MKLKKTIAAVIAAVITSSILSILAIASSELPDFGHTGAVNSVKAGDVYTQASIRDGGGTIDMRFVYIISEKQAKTYSGVGFQFYAKGNVRYVTTTNAYKKLNVGSSEVDLPDGLYASVYTVYNIPAGSNDVDLCGAGLVKSPDDLYDEPVLSADVEDAGKIPNINVPNVKPSGIPSATPSEDPSENPSGSPSGSPSESPSDNPSSGPSETPSMLPSMQPSEDSSETPSEEPSESPLPSIQPSEEHSESPE